MCGVVGYLGHREVIPVLLEGLQRLEYRGYDSAGVAVVTSGELTTIKAEGKLSRLLEKIGSRQVSGTCGLGHTRWATHGRPSETNAHPIVDARGRLAVIHNGIVENFLPLKRRLQEDGWLFTSDTDTEVIANLVSSHLENDVFEAVERASRELEGTYAFAVVSTLSREAEIIAARNGPPLVLGLGDGEVFLGSDPAVLLGFTRDVVFLENGDRCRLTFDGYEVRNQAGEPVERLATRLSWDPIQIEKAGFKHFMLKEIHEQPQAIQDTIAGRVDFERRTVDLDELWISPPDAARIRRVQLLACGTSWHAALIGKFLIEELARVPVDVDYGSEYRYREPLVDEGVFAVGVSQSGETADTLAAMEMAAAGGARVSAICNVPGSQMARIAEGVLSTHAGPEIGVASTKAFTTQLIALYLLALHLRQQRGLEISPDLLTGLAHLPTAAGEVLAVSERFEELARRFAGRRNFLYIGRGLDYPIALEGALKLKEISYIHAEGYPAGEMKHGPIALIDRSLPVVAIATGERVVDKVLANVQETRARDGVVIMVTDRDAAQVEGLADEIVYVPRVMELLQPVVNVVPLQLFAYFVAVWLGADVDQPRNLAKSVTVE